MEKSNNIPKDNIHNRDLEYDLTEFILGKDELDDIRGSIPMLNLYEEPYIGTEDIRQFAYCKRKLYYRYVIRAPMPPTYKMEFGQEIHDKFQQLSGKSKKKIQKYHNVYLTDTDLGLVGIIDYFEFDGHEAYPVEIKTGYKPKNKMDNPDKMQVTAQAILIEKNFGFLVKKVKVLYWKYDEIIEYDIDVNDKLKVIKMIDEIKELLETERVPEPVKDPKMCNDCECAKYCVRG
ncbi:MAG: CRISPR-associated protein Cas4 [Promethearchaeota archaeon]